MVFINHRNLIHYVGFSENIIENTAFIDMEYCHLGSLGCLIETLVRDRGYIREQVNYFF